MLLIPPTRRATLRGLSDTFSPADPRALAILRILLLGLMFGFYIRHDFSIWGSLPVSFRRTLWTFDLFGLEIASQRTLTGIEFIWKTSLITAAIGLYTRLSLAVAVVFGYYLLALPNQFGKVGHGDGILVFALLILMFSRCADAWSVDRLLARRRGFPVHPIVPGRDYFWPIQLVRLLTCVVFFAAGYAKLANSGWDWVFSNNLALVLRQHHVIPTINPVVDWGLWIADRAWVYQPMAFMTILVELALPLALFSKWARIILVPTMFSMQVGIALTMGVVFEQFMYIYLFWLPLAGLFDRRRLARLPLEERADTRASQPAFA
ncbi:MAG TPA: hypothetical protein PKB10_04790 [Tepidisphaeraceae bacterium]|nr:hypothetical protein [Tepidisphaeraceae bacterium]